MKPRAVFEQVGLSNITTHAVPKQKKRSLRVPLLKQLTQFVQVILYPLPAILIGEMAENTLLGRPPMAALIERVKIDAALRQCLTKICIAATVFAHPVGKQHYGAGRCPTTPVVHMHGNVVAGGQRKGLLVHGESL
jgi:hypothetical protein